MDLSILCEKEVKISEQWIQAKDEVRKTLDEEVTAQKIYDFSKMVDDWREYKGSYLTRMFLYSHIEYSYLVYLLSSAYYFVYREEIKTWFNEEYEKIVKEFPWLAGKGTQRRVKANVKKVINKHLHHRIRTTITEIANNVIDEKICKITD